MDKNHESQRVSDDKGSDALERQQHLNEDKQRGGKDASLAAEFGEHQNASSGYRGTIDFDKMGPRFVDEKPAKHQDLGRPAEHNAHAHHHHHESTGVSEDQDKNALSHQQNLNEAKQRGGEGSGLAAEYGHHKVVEDSNLNQPRNE